MAAVETTFSIQTNTVGIQPTLKEPQPGSTVREAYDPDTESSPEQSEKSGAETEQNMHASDDSSTDTENEMFTPQRSSPQVQDSKRQRSSKMHEFINALNGSELDVNGDSEEEDTFRHLGEDEAEGDDASTMGSLNPIDGPPKKRKESHNAIEQRRRDRINENMNKLKMLLPNVTTRKTEKALVLEKTVEYIIYLERQIATLREETVVSHQETIRLKHILGQMLEKDASFVPPSSVVKKIESSAGRAETPETAAASIAVSATTSNARAVLTSQTTTSVAPATQPAAYHTVPAAAMPIAGYPLRPVNAAAGGYPQPMPQHYGYAYPAYYHQGYHYGPYGPQYAHNIAAGPHHPHPYMHPAGTGESPSYRGHPMPSVPVSTASVVDSKDKEAGATDSSSTNSNAKKSNAEVVASVGPVVTHMPRPEQ